MHQMIFGNFGNDEVLYRMMVAFFINSMSSSILVGCKVTLHKHAALEATAGIDY